MMSDEDKHQIIKELARRLSAEPILASAFESAVEKIFKKYGLGKNVEYYYPVPRLTTASQPLIDLLNKTKEITNTLAALGKFQLNNELQEAADAVAKLYSVKL